MDLSTAKRCAITCIAVPALLSASSALAVEARVYQLENGGAIAPHLRVELGLDDNPLRGENGSEASAFFRVEPDIKYIVRRRNNNLTFAYTGQYQQYFSQFCSDPVDTGLGFGNSVDRPGDCFSSASSTSDKASFQNHAFGLSGYLEFSRRARATLAISTAINNQPLGTGLSSFDSVLAQLREPDSFVRNNLRAGFSYGANQARGELRFGLNFRDREFRDNGGRDLSGIGESFLEPSASIFYRIGSRTQLFAGLSTAEVNGGNSERGIQRTFVGVEFDASAITSGSIRITDVTEDFDAATRGDLNYTGFDVDLTWRPRRFSTVTIGGGRETERATLTEALAITTSLDVEWLHYWRDRFSTSLGVSIQRNETTGRIVNDDANDRTNLLRLEGNYNIRRWLDVGAFFESDNRDGENTNGESRDYARTVIGLTANGTF